MPNAARRAVFRLFQVFLASLLLACLTLSVGIFACDDAAFRSFALAAHRWQKNPEFRAISFEYAVLGSDAMRTHPLFMPAKSEILALRSIPGLPKSLAVNPTSRLHYERFSRGPLSAYLHLCSEQDVPDLVGVVESAGRDGAPTRADLRQILDAFQMDFPVVHDDGALASASAFLRDADASRPFPIRTNIGPLLAEPIAQIARQLHLPPEPSRMTPDEQQAVLDRLDPYLRSHDRPLWRTKQISDFSGGVWAQVFSPPYAALISPIVESRELLRFALLALLVIAIAYARMNRVKPVEPTIGGAAKTEIRGKECPC